MRLRPRLTGGATLLLVLLASFNSHAVSIEPFEARYHVYRADSHVANSKMSLKKENAEWVWSMHTEPRGMYSWLTKKRPFSKTHLQSTPSGLQLLLEQSGDHAQKPAQESSWFDYTHLIIYHMKGTTIDQIKLPGEVYNYHSVHTLYPLMLEQQTTSLKINFYRNGSISTSTLTLEKEIEIPERKSTIKVDKVTQKFDRSDKQMIYYYQGETLAPLKIEQIKPGKDSSVMWRVSATRQP